MESINYVSKELLKNTTAIWNGLTSLEQQYLNEKTTLISDMLTSRFDKLKFLTNYYILNYFIVKEFYE